MSNKLEIIIKYYNDISNLGARLWKTTTALASLNVGEVLKIWFCDKNFKDLSTLDQSFIYTQYVETMLSKVAITGEYQGNSISDSQWDNCFTEIHNIDCFLSTKLQELVGVENKNIIDHMLDGIGGDINSLEFSTLVTKTQVFLRNDSDQSEQLIETAKKIDSMAYPLTAKYFLYRYLAKAILCTNTPSVSSSYETEFNTVKKAHCNFANYLNLLKNSLTRIEISTNKYNEDHKLVACLTATSDCVINHSDKIAITYVSLIAGVIVLRSYVIDEKNTMYELCALPTTVLAMIQIVLSFPGTVLSNRQTKEINNNMFQELNHSEENTENIKFLFDHTPSFSYDVVNTPVISFRYFGNLILQPIDLINSAVINNLIGKTALRWFAAAGVVEEQSKVIQFMQNKLIKFLHHKIVPALIENKKLAPEEIKPYFQLLYKHSKKDNNTQIKLQEIYNKLTNQDIDFNHIASDITIYPYWKVTAMCSAIATIILDYTFCFLRKEELEFYEDPMFYAATSIKFMRLASLLISTYCGNKVIENITGEQLTNDVLFQKFYYHDAARLTVAVVPLIMFESIKDLKWLSLATLIDVLTTAISDLNVGNAISSAGKNIAEHTANTLTWLNNIALPPDTNDDGVINIDTTEAVSCLGYV